MNSYEYYSYADFIWINVIYWMNWILSGFGSDVDWAGMELYFK